MMKISVVGLGYIGLPTAIVLAKAGHDVYGFDVNESVIETLNEGKIHIVENNLEEAYLNVLKTNKFKAYSELQPADAYIIAVPTPFKHNTDKKIADLSYVESASKMVAKLLKEGDLVILESTVPPNTTKMMTDILENESGISRDKFYSVHCPERVLPGRILYELEHNDRIIGAELEEAAIKAKELYESFVTQGTCYLTDDVTAEMCKLVENTFRDINIAYANELSIISDKLGINVNELINLANKHPRVNILTPGVGVGGHCLAVDPWFIVEQFPEEAKVIYNSRVINDFKPIWISNKVEENVGFDKNKTIGILGLAYKPNIDDLRESPSIELAHNLIEKGYNVIGCEPNVEYNEIENITIKDFNEVINESDYLVLTLAHKEFVDNVDELKNQDIYDCIGLLK